MAAPGKKKKVVQQEELRRLMKAKQREIGSSRKRIESPLAKYPFLGHLSCVVCNVQIKSELLWQAHILGKQHKEKVAELKGTKANASAPSVSAQSLQAVKRKGPSIETGDTKKTRELEEQAAASTLPAGFFEKTDQPTKDKANSSGLRLLAGDYEDDEDEEEEQQSNKVPENQTSSSSKSTEIPLPPPTADDGLPPDFFDSKTPVVSHSGSIVKADIQEQPVERKENTAEALPEGFFDDPEVDAKIRKVDAPKDQMDKEWEEFQKEIRQVNNVSEAIVAEEDEEGRLDRQIEEIDEQIECYRRIEHLRNRKDVLHDSLKDALKSKSSNQEDDDDTGSDDEMLSLMLAQNWREKEAFL
ncbi:zinc finger protein 830 [Gastrophryne carolinensis]